MNYFIYGEIITSGSLSTKVSPLFSFMLFIVLLKKKGIETLREESWGSEEEERSGHEKIHEKFESQKDKMCKVLFLPLK